jgi:hypothetical protein
VGLNIGVGRTKQGLDPLNGKLFSAIDVLAATVVALWACITRGLV